MDHTRDNPLKRFSAFWIALLMIGLFGLVSLIFRPITHSKQESVYMLKEEQRLETKAAIDFAQAASLEGKDIDKAIQSFAKTLNQSPAPGVMAVDGAAPQETN